MKKKQKLSEEIKGGVSNTDLSLDVEEQFQQEETVEEEPVIVEPPVEPPVEPQPRQRVMPTTPQPVAEKPSPSPKPQPMQEMPKERVMETLQSSFVDKEKISLFQRVL